MGAHRSVVDPIQRNCDECTLFAQMENSVSKIQGCLSRFGVLGEEIDIFEAAVIKRVKSKIVGMNLRKCHSLKRFVP